jgi:hypothetical protein
MSQSLSVVVDIFRFNSVLLYNDTVHWSLCSHAEHKVTGECTLTR